MTGGARGPSDVGGERGRAPVSARLIRSAYRSRIVFVLWIVILGMLGCVQFSSNTDRGGEALFRVVEAAPRDPSAAVVMFADIGPVPGLETVRETAWLEALRRCQAPSAQWEAYLADGPSEAHERDAELGLGQALLREEKPDRAALHLESAMRAGSVEAGELLAAHGSSELRRRAERWLAVHGPRSARFSAGSAVVRSLSPEEKLQRARSLLRLDRATTALSELRAWYARGAVESERLRLLARAAVDADRPGTALQLLPSGRAADSGDHLLRARAWRQRGWDRFPRRSANRAFALALSEARRALSDPRVEQQAQEMIVEAAVETRQLEAAWRAWRRLAELGWDGTRRSWLGRRLGVALAREGAVQRVHALEREIPEHARCLAFWRATLTGDRAELSRLASEPALDVYAAWLEADGKREPTELLPGPARGPGFVPGLVDDVLGRGHTDIARRLWWAAVESRGTDPAEAVALAAFELRHDRPVAAITILVGAFPELSTGRLSGVPKDVLAMYFPLRWREEIATAAHESKVDPWLLAGQVRQESLFRPHARSPRGAVGLMQLLPSTAAVLGPGLGLGRRPDLHDPPVNLRLGAAEMSRLIDEFDALEYALAAYNAGPNRVRRWKVRWSDPRRFAEAIPIPETYWYVRRVLFLQRAYAWLYPDAWPSDG